MDITIITLTIGLLTYCFFRAISTKNKMNTVELSDVDKEELAKIEKIAGKQLPYKFSNNLGIKFQIIELVRPGYIKRRLFDEKGHCHFLIKYHLDRTIAEFIEFGKTDGHYFRKTIWNVQNNKTEFFQYKDKQLESLAKIKAKLQYYKAIVDEGRTEILPLQNDLKQYANELENHALCQKDWVKRKGITDTAAIHSIVQAEKIDFAKKRDLKRALSLRNVLRIKAINSGFKTYNKTVADFQKRMVDLHLGEIKHLHQMDVLSAQDLRHVSNLLAGSAAEELVNRKIRPVQADKVLIHNLILPYPYEKIAGLGSNQIDHLVIASSGIFCFETKARTSKAGKYNVLEDYGDIADQVAKHKESIKYVLNKSNNPVIINLLKRIPSIDALIRNVVVFVSRNEDKFILEKVQRYQKVGIEVAQLDDIQSLLVKAKNNIGLKNEEIEAIAKELTNNDALEEEKTFPENILLFSDEGDLNQGAVNEQLYHANQVIKHIEHINDLLSDYLKNAREWQKENAHYQYWRKFYNQVSLFKDATIYHEQNQLKKDVLDEI